MLSRKMQCTGVYRMGHTKCQNAIKQKRKTRIRLLCIFFFVSNEALLSLVLTREKSLPEKLALLTFTQKIINTRVRPFITLLSLPTTA